MAHSLLWEKKDVIPDANFWKTPGQFVYEKTQSSRATHLLVELPRVYLLALNMIFVSALRKGNLSAGNN